MNLIINDSYWLSIVDQISRASTCKVAIGTILIKNKSIVSHGFLGSISGDYHCLDKGCLEVQNNGKFGSSNIGTSCIRTIHSEMNAILKCNVRGELECYTTYQPCLNCLKALLAIGTRKIVYIKEYKDEWRDDFIRETRVSMNMYKYSE